MAFTAISLFSAFIFISSGFKVSGATIVGGSEDVASTVVKSQPFSPQVVFQCGYRNRYLSRDGTGEWVTDKDPHAGCLTGKLDILKYCRKVYPDLEITNIVESSHFYDISNWCKLDGHTCKWSFWVKPYRCIVGAFESEALLVPESCHFGHVDERNICKDFDYWNRSAHSECSKRPATPVVKSFAMLDPCGLDMFSGVEFVCCPDRLPPAKTTPKDVLTEPSIQLDVKVKLDKNRQAAENVDDEDDYSDEDDESDEEEEEEYDQGDVRDGNEAGAPRLLVTSASVTRQAAPNSMSKITAKQQASTAKTPTTIPLDESDEDYEDDEGSESDEDSSDEQDPYFRVADPDSEHGEYAAALERLEKRHRQKVAKVMKEWSELESRYQEMKEKDPNRGEQFRGEMTSRFQRTVAALEEENRDERRQIEEVHQQRVNAFLNERKRETMKAFQDALSAANPQSQKVLRTLQAYIRAEEKDRVHSLNRYRRLLSTDADTAAVMKRNLVRKMDDIDARINATIELLHDAPQIEAKVKPAILDFWKTFRNEHTPRIVDDASISVEVSNGDILLESYKKQYQTKLKAKESENNEATSFEKQQLGDEDDESGPPLSSPFDGKSSDDDKQVVRPVVIEAGDEFATQEDTGGKEHKYVEQEDAEHAHAFSLKEILQHDMAIKEEMAESSQHSAGGHVGYVVFGVAGVTLLVAMLGAILFIKRQFSARGQGFVKLDRCTPEERHVSAMQVNGYENPTYKYFDDKP